MPTPSTTFTGVVLQVRLQATIVSNVTTYPTIIDVPNPEAKLRPGMTATVKVVVASRSDVLRVPNAALRVRPTAEMLAALGKPASGGWRGREALQHGRPGVDLRGRRAVPGARSASASPTERSPNCWSQASPPARRS